MERPRPHKGHLPQSAAWEGFCGRLKAEFFHRRGRHGVSAERFAAEPYGWIHWCCEDVLRLFDAGIGKEYDVTDSHRGRLAPAA